MKRLLVANRGEIAVRIFCAARELDIHTVAIYCESDTSHISFADESIALPGASSFLDVGHLVKLCRDRRIDAVHPGYGFLSESAEFASKLRKHGVAFVGPSADVLELTGSKIEARKLASACKVPVLPALETCAESWQAVADFAEQIGYPVMLKAVDGGGGRGIRLVKQRNELEAACERAVAESPSRSVFAEKALLEGCRHIEVQILGDGTSVRHFWERECSLQRRYQKVVEFAPSMIEDRDLLGQVIQSAMEIAKYIKYSSLGTFEFLVSPSSHEYYFMEINPRLQVEHTVTEVCSGVDLVQLQLLVASGSTLEELALAMPNSSQTPPPNSAIQLRVTAEDVRRDFALSVGRINGVSLPRGNGIRVDTHIEQGTIISAEFDSLLAKIIVSGLKFESCVRKGLRALTDLSIDGITTNLDLLEGILLCDDFKIGACDTQWLEKNLKAAIETGARSKPSRRSQSSMSQPRVTIPSSSSGATIKKNDAWELSISSEGETKKQQYHVKVDRIFRNDFPNRFGADISLQTRSDQETRSTYTLELTRSDSSTVGGGSSQRQGDTQSPSQLICPLAGQLVEMLVDEGDEVAENDAVAIVRQMKMELEVRAHRSGTIRKMWDVEDGDDVDAGALVCEIEEQSSAKAKL